MTSDLEAKRHRSPAEARAAELRMILGCAETERTVEKARAVMLENAALRRENELLKAKVGLLNDALSVAWSATDE